MEINSVKFYDLYTGLIRNCFRQLRDIGKYSDIWYAQKFKFLIDGIKAKNSEIIIGKVSVMNDKLTRVMDTNFEKDISYLNNRV